MAEFFGLVKWAVYSIGAVICTIGLFALMAAGWVLYWRCKAGKP